MNSVQSSRRALFGLIALASGLLRSRRVRSAQTFGMESTKLIEIRHVPADYTVFCERLRLTTGQSWSLTYPGPFSATVEAGGMTVPMIVEKRLHVVRMPRLNGTPVAENITGPDLPVGWGVFSETGDYGSIENRQSDDLVVLILTVSPPEGMR